MELSVLVSHALHRPLRPEEVEVLRCLSAGGMAKLNTDLCRGVNLRHTMAQLQGALRHVKARRESAAERLSEPARALLGRLSSAWPTEVMEMVAETSLEDLTNELDQRTAQGERLADVLEELAMEHLQAKLNAEAQLLADTHGVSVTLSRLCPTQAVAEGNLRSPVFSTTADAKGSAGLSPVALWFNYPPSLERALQGSAAFGARLGQSSSSTHGVLKTSSGTIAE
eukprot:RCo030531